MRYSLTQVPLTVSPFLSCPRNGITVSPQAAKTYSLQAIRFQHNTHSFPQRRQPIPRPFNHLRTLLPLTTSFFSTYSSAPSANSCFARFLFSFQQLAASLPPPKKSTPLQSSESSLFLQNTRGGGRSRIRHSDVQTRVPAAMVRSPLVRRGDAQTVFRVSSRGG